VQQHRDPACSNRLNWRIEIAFDTGINADTGVQIAKAGIIQRYVQYQGREADAQNGGAEGIPGQPLARNCCVDS
jgi:hypothetical protein